MKLFYKATFIGLSALLSAQVSDAQITLLQNYQNKTSATIGVFQGISFREGGFSGLTPIAGTNGKEFWTLSDRGVNVDAANANTAACRPTYDKIYGFQNYAPKIHRIRVMGDSIQILRTLTIKRPDGTGATGVLNPTGFGSTATEQASTDTVLDCARFSSKIAPKDIWAIDSEGIVQDAEGNFWLCEEGGPTIWKLNRNGKVVARYTPFATKAGAQSIDMLIDTVFKYRKNNRGFEGLAIAPNGKVYATIQSPLLFPTKAVGENTRIHRIVELDPKSGATRMFAYLNDGVIGTGADQIRLRDWKISDMAAVNDSCFLVIEAGLRGATDKKNIYLININQATPISSAFYGGKTLEELVDATGLSANGIKPVKKTLFLDLLANGWPSNLEKAEGIAIVNDSTIAVCNDNDYGQGSPAENGIAAATGVNSHLLVYGLKGVNKLQNFKPLAQQFTEGFTGPSSSQAPYLSGIGSGVKVTALFTTGDKVGNYRMAGAPDGLGAFDNNDGTFTLLSNHEFGNAVGAVHAHGVKGAFVSKWVIRKSDLTVLAGEDLIKKVNLWNGTGYTAYGPADTTSKKAFGRFCSADLPEVSAFYNTTTGLGTQERIFMNGEEAGNEGRALAHIVTGTNAGTSYELPALGKLSYENAVANPAPADKTIVVGTDDSTPGQVYVYVGTKTNTGTEVEKAGLTNGKLYGLAVSNLLAETSAGIPLPNTSFSLIDLGDVRNTSGNDLNTKSNAMGVTTFLRPEDAAWDPTNPNDFYFVTTNAVTSPSRLWRARFKNIAKPEEGGTITAVLDGTEGQKILDNLTVDHFGNILMVEDVGNNAHLGKVWQYTIATDNLKAIATHDSTRFITGASNFLTQDEEASGILDVQSILGPGMFIIDDQAHYAIPGELVEGGQFLVVYAPDVVKSMPEITLKGNGIEIVKGDITPSPADNTDFGTTTVGVSSYRDFVLSNTGGGVLTISEINFSGANAGDFKLDNGISFPYTIPAGSTPTLRIRFLPQASGTRTATMTVSSNDLDESNYPVAFTGNAEKAITVNVAASEVFEEVLLSPNPSDHATTLAISSRENEKVTITVLDVNGRTVGSALSRQLAKGINKIELNTGHLSNGTYFINLVSKGESMQLKTVVLH